MKASVEWLNPDGSPGFRESCGIRNFGGACRFRQEEFPALLPFRGLKYPLFADLSTASLPSMSLINSTFAAAPKDMEQRGFYLSEHLRG